MKYAVLWPESLEIAWVSRNCKRVAFGPVITSVLQTKRAAL